MAGKEVNGKKVAVGAELPSEQAAMLMNWEETVSFASVLFPLLGQAKPRCCLHAGSTAVLPLLPEPRLTGLGMAAVERSYEGQGL